MKLKLYIKQHGMTYQRFAELSGISYVTLWRIINSKFLPSLQTLNKIAKATKGKVSFKDFLGE